MACHAQPARRSEVEAAEVERGAGISFLLAQDLSYKI